VISLKDDKIDQKMRKVFDKAGPVKIDESKISYETPEEEQGVATDMIGNKYYQQDNSSFKRRN
jgi:hypothetical protein